ncbi:MAG: hypothetical protein JOZ51_01635 [Chloroflexi bacterium]|nr:hypothetical protein [Chloroflexota bacterium]
MPDFFTRLAERTLGLANTIQPVLPSRFAPGAPGIAAGMEVEQELTIEESTPQPSQQKRSTSRSIEATVEQQRTPAQPPHDQQSATRVVVHQPDQPPAPTVERAAPAQPRRDPAPVDRPSHTAPPAETSHLIERHAESAQPTMRSSAPAAQSDAQRFAPAAHQGEHPRLVDAPAPSLRSNEQRTSLERQTTLTEPAAQALPSDERHDPGEPRATLLPLTDERQVPYAQRRDSTAPAERPELVEREQNPPRASATPRTIEPSATQAGPQIHVSIGRIEVRAVTPPPAPAARPAPTPTPRMSLDDYLRSQNGDRR